jgi:hypothetical protein
MHFTFAALAPLLFLSGIAEAGHGKGRHEVEVDKNWAGVNSFFLHAFPEYEPIDARRKNDIDSASTDRTVSMFSMPSKQPT